MFTIKNNDSSCSSLSTDTQALSPYNRNGTCGTGGSVQRRVRLRYLRFVPGTSDRVQSCLWYRLYRTVREKLSYESLMKWSSL